MKGVPKRIGWFLLFLVGLSCEPESYPVVHPPLPAFVPPDPKVVLFIIDGPRYQDTFGDPTHAHVEQIWSQMRPFGTVCSNFRNLGLTLTISGHCAMLTGVWQPLNNEGLERPDNPTLFEYYRKATGAPQNDAVLIGGKPKLDACAYSDHVDYGSSFGASSDLGYSTIGTYDRLIERLQTEQPHFVMVSFSQVDQKAHTGVWADYIAEMELVDGLAAQTWNYLQSDPFYAGQTYFFMSADHGRHDDAHGGFQNHGDTCPGCQQLIFLALGPDIRADYEVTTLYTQRDLAATIGDIMGFAMPYSSGSFMEEIFEPTTTGVR